jgi:hypothetical protein
MSRNSLLITHYSSLLGILLAASIGPLIPACSREKGDHPRPVADEKQLGIVSVSLADMNLDPGIVVRRPARMNRSSRLPCWRRVSRWILRRPRPPLMPT